MKKIALFLILASLLCFDCSAPATAQKSDGDRSSDMTVSVGGSQQQQLAAILSRQAGVTVTGNEGNYLVKIRSGVSSFSGIERPLFVVNGNRIGRNFESAAQALSGLKVSLIKVLKDSDATFYGVAGASGVIEITAKQM
ncbi:MAG: TonB-dependent receptor plug domain-containing protein [Saprospiraceae bacterium]|nr:TonB-dependent receptor plug domain-containing protein [Saprospiraceae bacterium]